MTGRRPLVAFLALFAFSMPACLHISTQTATPITTPEQAAKITDSAKNAKTAPLPPEPPRMEFAVLPKVPGTKVPTNPGAPSANSVVKKPPTAPAPPTPLESPVRPLGSQEPSPLPFTQVSVPAEAPLVAAIRAYSEGRVEKSIEIIRTLDKQNQDLVLALMPILARGASADLANDPATVAALVEQLRSAATRLEPRAALKVEKAFFCNHVEGFGRFSLRPDNQPYRPYEKAQLYLEVGNLGSQPSGNGFATHVQAAVEVRDAHGQVVGQVDKDDVHRRVPVVRFDKRLESHSPLHDFHVLYVFSVPPAPGVYTVSVELRDAAGRRTVTTQPARFCVAGP